MTGVLAVIPVRDGRLPLGGAETADECGGRAVLIGSGARASAASVTGDLRCIETGEFRPAAWARALAALLADEAIIVLPSSADGRDLAPRLAAELERSLFTNAIHVSDTHVVMTRDGGLTMHTVTTPAHAIITLQVGSRGVDPPDLARTAATVVRDLTIDIGPMIRDADVVEVLEPDAASIDLAEAERIVGGGAGLEDQERFDDLARLGELLGASVGATRVITDRGWIEHQRQIGTTGVVVDPRLYIAFGISGAVQHTSGLGNPDHIVSINTDASCPMMLRADLAVVADANTVLTELLALLAPTAPGESSEPEPSNV